MMRPRDTLRKIPSVERILSDDRLALLVERYGRTEVRDEVRRYLDSLRKAGGGDMNFESLRDEVERSLENGHGASLFPVVNGTGVLIHTNLGRAPVASEVWADAARVAGRYSNLEFDLETGERGSRHAHISRIARRLFGCEAALLVNNNAGAVLLVLASIAAGREVVVSRGELVEIGGSFRVPDVIVQGGARLREVGTTNRTRANDYAGAIDRATAAILSVHQSNFQIVGFTESPAVESLVAVAREAEVPLVVDEGSGRVVDLSPWGFERKETIRELLDKGVDVVTCSTDKLIGATQGGLIVGRRELVDRCAKHPLMRALRPGKESYSIVTATLAAFLAGKQSEVVPLYRMLSTETSELRERADRIASECSATPCVTESALGGGTTPAETMTSVGVAIAGDPDSIARSLLRNEPPIVGRIRDDRFHLDLRTIFPDEDRLVIDAVRRLG